MNPAELKTIRESLNLTCRELGDRVGVRSVRTVQFWEAEEDGRPIPPQVSEALLAWDEAVNSAVMRVAAHYLMAMDGEDEITLLRQEHGEFDGDTLPHSRRLHHAYLARLRRELTRIGLDVTIEFE